MNYHVETFPRKGFPEHHGEHVRHDIKDIGMTNAPKVRYSQVYRFEGELTADEMERIASQLLIDPVTEEYRLAGGNTPAEKARGHEIEVWLKHGVTDTVAESVVKAVRDLGIDKEIRVKTGHRFVFEGNITAAAVRQIAERLLVNPMVQEYTLQ